jgi:hypothetical protein
MGNKPDLELFGHLLIETPRATMPEASNRK